MGRVFRASSKARLAKTEVASALGTRALVLAVLVVLEPLVKRGHRRPRNVVPDAKQCAGHCSQGREMRGCQGNPQA